MMLDKDDLIAVGRIVDHRLCAVDERMDALAESLGGVHGGVVGLRGDLGVLHDAVGTVESATSRCDGGLADLAVTVAGLREVGETLCRRLDHWQRRLDAAEAETAELRAGLDASTDRDRDRDERETLGATVTEHLDRLDDGLGAIRGDVAELRAEQSGTRHAILQLHEGLRLSGWQYSLLGRRVELLGEELRGTVTAVSAETGDTVTGLLAELRAELAGRIDRVEDMWRDEWSSGMSVLRNEWRTEIAAAVLRLRDEIRAAGEALDTAARRDQRAHLRLLNAVRDEVRELRAEVAG